MSKYRSGERGSRSNVVAEVLSGTTSISGGLEHSFTLESGRSDARIDRGHTCRGLPYCYGICNQIHMTTKHSARAPIPPRAGNPARHGDIQATCSLTVSESVVGAYVLPLWSPNANTSDKGCGRMSNEIPATHTLSRCCPHR